MLKELFMLIGFLFKKVKYGMDELPIIGTKYFPFRGYSAMMWCCYLLDNITDNFKITPKIMNHEMVHYKQICTIGNNILYYLIYLWEWFKLVIRFCPAYNTHPMEIEAYINEVNPNYETYKGKWKKYKLKHPRKEFKKHKYGWKNYIRNYFKDVQ